MGHRWLFVLPAVLTPAVPYLLFGDGLDLSGDVGESTLPQAVAEVALAVTPAAVMAWLRRDEPGARRPSMIATLIGGVAVAAAIVSYFVSESPYAAQHEPWVGQAVTVAVLAALLAPHLRWWWAIALVPVLLWHEPLAEVLYLSSSSYGPPAAEYFALALRATAAGLVVAVVDGSLALTRRLGPAPAVTRAA